MFQGISTENMALYSTVPAFQDPEIPIDWLAQVSYPLGDIQKTMENHILSMGKLNNYFYGHVQKLGEITRGYRLRMVFYHSENHGDQ